MKILRLFWLDLQKLASIRLMYTFIILPALFAVNSWFVAVAFLVYAYMVPYGIFSYDDTSIADNFYGVLPVRREHRVAARYLFAVFCLLLMAVLMLLVNVAAAYLFGWQPLTEDFWAALVLGAAAGTLFLDVAFPLILRLGAQKANNNVLIFFVLIFLMLSFYGEQLLAQLPPHWQPALALFCLVAFMASFQVSLRFFSRREFFDYVPMAEVRRAKPNKRFVK